MANEFYTLIVVPHAKARFRKFQVSVRLTRWVLGSLSVLALALVGIVVHYTMISVEVAELKRLQGENLALATKARAYEENAGRLQARVLTLQNMVTKLGLMAGVEKSLPDAQVGGVGGLSSLETTAPSVDIAASLEGIDQTVSALTQKSTRLQAFFEDQQQLLSATPSIWPVRGYLSASFGNRKDPFTGMPDFHPGIDVSTPRGTPVVAPADGVVVFVGKKRGYGKALVIDHGYGVVTRYGHLDGWNVRPGQRVRRGDSIAFVGNTGRSTAPHLHYEVWVDDQLRNPIEFILDEYRSFG
ncbi:MAG: M23 family metallopeptidase [Acidobacteria bacterium]|jgi:murein DD-endopeptidase MepM/ murein hydrolase activator NlpD|nr:M23 family metallopeptidase [Acidobacteriota bacterium]